MSYFTSEYETSASQLDRKWYDVWLLEEMIYIDIGYKSAHQQTDKWRKDTWNYLNLYSVKKYYIL